MNIWFETSNQRHDLPMYESERLNLNEKSNELYLNVRLQLSALRARHAKGCDERNKNSLCAPKKNASKFDVCVWSRSSLISEFNAHLIKFIILIFIFIIILFKQMFIYFLILILNVCYFYSCCFLIFLVANLSLTRLVDDSQLTKKIVICI